MATFEKQKRRNRLIPLNEMKFTAEKRRVSGGQIDLRRDLTPKLQRDLLRIAADVDGVSGIEGEPL
jgi:hypothetical protein